MQNKESKTSQSINTELPATSQGQQKKAESYLDLFAPWTDGYKHRNLNPYLNWLRSNPRLKPDAVYRFHNFWHPVSRHQPQILLQIMSAYPDWSDRHLIYLNWVEEDGMVKEDDNPHYDLHENLIVSLGGKLDVDPEADEIVTKFHKSIQGMTPAEATGYVAAIEHPALDISDYFITMTKQYGDPKLLTTDPYLYIHVDVEPRHLIWSHGNALDWMEDEEKMERLNYRKQDVIDAFTHAMSFWNKFWALAFAKLGYLQS